MTTINNMLEHGAEIHGCVIVKRYDNAEAEYVTVFDQDAGTWFFSTMVDEPWANVDISYMYAKHDGGDCVLVIEVADDEWSEEAEQVWACADCADFYEPEAGPILDYADGWWTCPKCGCNTCAPEEDLCYRVDGKTAYIG